MDNYAKFVKVVDRFTRTTWHRKIGDGPWKEMDCSVYPGGLPPVLFLKHEGYKVSDVTDVQWVEETSLHDPREFENKVRG